MDRFDPHCKPLYSKEGLLGMQLLLLGESHYAKDVDKSPKLTQEIVCRYCYEHTSAYFTKVRRLVLRALRISDAREHDRPWFWDRVAFYNYVPELVGENSRMRPTVQQWELGARQFPDVLQELNPSVILVLGKELWANLPAGTPINGGDCRRYANRCIAGMVMHPSAPRWKYDDWVPKAETLFKHRSVGTAPD